MMGTAQMAADHGHMLGLRQPSRARVRKRTHAFPEEQRCIHRRRLGEVCRRRLGEVCHRRLLCRRGVCRRYHSSTQHLPAVYSHHLPTLRHSSLHSSLPLFYHSPTTRRSLVYHWSTYHWSTSPSTLPVRAVRPTGSDAGTGASLFGLDHGFESAATANKTTRCPS